MLKPIATGEYGTVPEKLALLLERGKGVWGLAAGGGLKGVVVGGRDDDDDNDDD